MKFITVLLAVLAVFSSVVLSQKVDPLTSSSVVGTAKEEEVSPMVRSLKKNLDALSISSESTQLIDQTNTPPLDSIVDTRQLNNDGCKKFKRNVSDPQFDPYTGPENYEADDGNGGTITLQAWCSSRNCCSTDGVVGQNNECREWSSKPDTVYEVCENSCKGELACKGVAKNAANGSTITFESGSCSGTSGSGKSCPYMASSTTKKLKLVVGENSCTNIHSCDFMAGDATNLEELTIGQESCTKIFSCLNAARFAESLKQLILDEYQCQSTKCSNCGISSSFSEALQLTEECCEEVDYEDFEENIDTACQYSEPSSIPSDQPSDQPSNQPSDQPSNVPSSIPSDQPSSAPSSMPSDIPSDVPSDQPSSAPSSMPSEIPSDVPSDQPSSIPSDQPSSEPSWLDDEQCKKKDSENDICAELDGRCKVDCKDDDNFVCVPGLCSYDKKWDKPTKSPKMRQLMNKDVEMVDMEITATGKAERKLKATKAPKSSCACRVPRRNRCN